jgi:hypothetical protein
MESAKEKVIGADRKRLGIGTLSEKTLHAILKHYYEPDEDCQEIPIGRYYADIYRDGKITEIQTAQFNRMRDKLEAFLPEYETTIVYPISYIKWLHWVDEETGEVKERRKVAKKGRVYDVFPELYKIKQYLKHPNLRLHILMMEMEEYKLLNGWGPQKKNHASKYDRIPVQICQEVILEKKEDYMQLVPYDLEEEFTSLEFAKVAHINRNLATVVLNILDHMEVVERMGKRKNAYLYRVKY